MPRALSLKKAHCVKNQKSITHFFARGESNTPLTETSVSKRKALSQPNIDVKKLKTCEKLGENNQNAIRSPGKENAKETREADNESAYLNDLFDLRECENSKKSSFSYINLNEEASNLCTNHDENEVKSKIRKMQTSESNQKTENGIVHLLTGPNPLGGIQCSPKSCKWTPEKIGRAERSPAKCGSTIKNLDFGKDNLDVLFDDEWKVDDIIQDMECLDLSTMQQCVIQSVTNNTHSLELKVKNLFNQLGTVYVEGVWLDTPLIVGDTISVLASKDASARYCVNNTSGLIILRPNHLMSTTSVVAGVFCRRKAVLQERWRGIDSANTAMIIGILVHELVQKALTQQIGDIERLQRETDNIIKNSIEMLYDAGLTEEEARMNMQIYISPLNDFIQAYVVEKSASKMMQVQKDKWPGRIDRVLDIEENVCCPQLGLKGKIDATLEVTIYDRKGKNDKTTVPLELKSGRASASAEHRGQLVMYGMMMSVQNRGDPTTDVLRGLLLYLKERVDLREVSCGYPERRDLMMLRNQLVQYLASGPEHADPEQITDIEDAYRSLEQKLPEPVRHETACSKCPYLTLCSLHMWHANSDGPIVSDDHPLAKLREQALGHLSSQHVNYFKHWTTLLRIEERGQMMVSPLHSLWNESPEKREKRGTCAANLTLTKVEKSGDKYIHNFKRHQGSNISDSKSDKGPQEGDFSIVSIEHRPWLAAGVVTLANEDEILIILERDLSRRLPKETAYYIDTYESYSTIVQNLTNLGVLMEDSDRALGLRRLIIDKEPAEFENKLPREVGRLGTKLMRSLNIEQQRAVLRTLSAKHYALLQGLPGTGKTQTISVLIQMLVGLKQRVLVTSHTHSAVDNVLSRLPESMKVMRLGAAARIASNVQSRSEHILTANCHSAAKLQQIYESMEVVGVTCLGANHSMLSRIMFDVCIVDEATQVLQSTVLRALFAANRFVLVGDPDQLPPVVRSRAARRLGMEESLFHRLMSEQVTSTLQLQYRMNKPIADFANKVAYSGRLKCADQNVASTKLGLDVQKISGNPDWLLKCCSPEPEDAVIFLDTKSLDFMTSENVGCSKSLTNLEEARVVSAIITVMKLGGVNPTDIGVIAPYRDQVSLLRSEISGHGVEASTVDQFQGRDKSVVLYSCTRQDEGQNDKKIKDGEVLNDQRRMAVSVTRARHKFIVIGDSRAMCRYVPLQRLIQHCSTIILNKKDPIWTEKGIS